MDIAWLQDFLALAETGNFTRAAARRNVSQAAFSRRIKALENWLDTTLVDRSVVPAQLTPEGVLFRREATDTLDKLLDARTRLTGSFRGRNAQVKIALPHVLASSRFTKWWKEWSDGTGISAATHIGNVTEVISRFISGSADILILHRGDQLPVLLEPKLFSSHVIENDRLVPCVSRSFVFGTDLDTGIAPAPIPLIMYSRGAYFARLVDSIIERAPRRIFGYHVVESEMSQVIRDCVAAGLGMGWIPQCILTDQWRGKIRLVTGQPLSLDLPIVAFSRRTGRSPAAAEIWDRISRGDRCVNQRQINTPAA